MTAAGRGGWLPRAATAVSCLAILLLSSCVETGSSAPNTAGGARAAGGLTAFHQALASLEAGKTQRVNIVQIGDSHTAGDHFSGRLRELFQSQFGNAGRGMLPPGSPFPYWRPLQVHVTQRGRWEVLSSNKRDYAQVPYGLSGFVLRSRAAGAAIVLEADNAFDTAEVTFFRRASGGHIDVLIDGARVGEIATRGGDWQMDHKSFAAKSGGRTLELRPRGDGEVDIADWSIWRNTRGVALSSHGFVGAEISLLDRWDSANVAAELRQLSPALIILAFGTNEGFAQVDTLGDYGSIMESRVMQLRQMAPNASIVIVGPPDAERLPDYCGVRGPMRDRMRCAPLSATEAQEYGRLLARRDRSLCRWHAPAGIALVRQQQRQVAERTGVLFWDWSSVQDGDCGATRWAHEGLGQRDRVHMTEAGYALSADRLHEALMRGYRKR
jgi:lysophospholipase L1-like esterase